VTRRGYLGECSYYDSTVPTDCQYSLAKTKKKDVDLKTPAGWPRVGCGGSLGPLSKIATDNLCYLRDFGSYISKRSPPLKKALVGGALNVGATEPMTRCQREIERNEAEDVDTRK